MIEHLPTHPAMLVSAINTLLRDDEFSDLDDLCSYYDKSTNDLLQQLAAEGYRYDSEQRQFKTES